MGRGREGRREGETADREKTGKDGETKAEGEGPARGTGVARCAEGEREQQGQERTRKDGERPRESSRGNVVVRLMEKLFVTQLLFLHALYYAICGK